MTEQGKEQRPTILEPTDMGAGGVPSAPTAITTGAPGVGAGVPTAAGVPGAGVPSATTGTPTATAAGTDLWGKPPNAPDRQDRTERRHHVISNLLTLLISGVIIAGGFLLPTLLYPYLNRYINETVQLTHPSEETIAGHVFEEPVTLYPWDLYDENLLRPLTGAERSLLEEKGVPDFLISILRDHGMEVNAETDESGYRTNIINSFRFLEPRDSADRSCFVLADTDINADGQADLRCAVNLEGNIISLLFASREWDTVHVKTPIGVPFLMPDDEQTEGEQSEGEELEDATTETETTDPTEGSDAGETNADIGPGEEGSTEGAPGEGDEETTGEDGTETTETPGNTGAADATDATQDGEGTLAQSKVEHPPVEEDQYLWSFAYTASREAKVIGQEDLFLAFRQLELVYEYRYGYSYTMLLPVLPAEPELLPDIEYLSLTPRVFATEEYLLYIYDLPNGERLILYLDPTSLRCMGFNLLRY
jgi:hypothetical protein